MIKVENIETYGFGAAIRGMRNPMNSWDKSDSVMCVKDCDECLHALDGVSAACDCVKDGSFNEDYFCIGHNDMGLMQRLFKGGPVHRKYLRMMIVTMDITCHHAWWAEFDTYKVGTVRNSCSKMHKIHVKEFIPKDFSHEGINECGGETTRVFAGVIHELERLRRLFNETQDKKYWRAIIELLPMGYNIKSTVMFSYETIFNMLEWRSNHKLDEWVEFCNILRTLPYVKELMQE